MSNVKYLQYFAAAALALAACNPQPPQVRASATPAPTQMPALTITGRGSKEKPVSIVRQTGNRKVYTLVANSYTSRSAQNVADAKFAQPTVTFYDKDGTTLTARAPAAALQGKQVVLSGGVHAETSKGMHMTCRTLTYDQTSGLLHGRGSVRIVGMQGGQRQTVTGNSFTSDVKLTRMVMR